MSISSVSPAQVPQIASFTLPPAATDGAKRKRETTPANGMLIAGSVLAATGGTALIGGLSWYGIRKHAEAKAQRKQPKTAELQAKQTELDATAKLTAAHVRTPVTLDEYLSGLQHEVDAKTSIEDGVYRERQVQQLCGLHALNTALYSLSGRSDDDFKSHERISVKDYLTTVFNVPAAELPQVGADAAKIAEINAKLRKCRAPIALDEAGKFSAPKSAAFQQGHLGHLNALARAIPHLVADTAEFEPFPDSEQGQVRQPFDFAAAQAGRENARALVVLRGTAAAEGSGGHFIAVVRPRGNNGRWAVVDSQSSGIHVIPQTARQPHLSAWDALQSFIAAEPTVGPCETVRGVLSFR